MAIDLLGKRRHGLSAAERLWHNSTMEPNSGCQIWLGPLQKKGYGTIVVAGKSYRAHRAAWTVANGPIPEGQMVLHKCDIRCCINPDHLFLGTGTDNMRDMVRKGRNASTKGSLNPRAKLTEQDVLAIRASAETVVALAAKYRVAHQLISMVRHRQVWSHVAQFKASV